VASQMGPKGLARTFEKEKIMRYGKKVFLECGLLSLSLSLYVSGFQPFSICRTFETLLSIWRNLETQNSANLSILAEPRE
jgi:hypothetical protein